VGFDVFCYLVLKKLNGFVAPISLEVEISTMNVFEIWSLG
jgi:hypothetical protein